MEGAKTWEKQPPRTLRRKGKRNAEIVHQGTGEALLGLGRAALRGREPAQRESEPGIVPSPGGRQHNSRRGKARQPHDAT